jgi:hypothetical protein
VRVLCCQVEISASGCSVGRRSPTECDVSECDREASVMRRPWRTRRRCATGGGGGGGGRPFGAIQCVLMSH